MFRESMPADEGMIFPMEPPRPASFWMKNTILPLDMVFIRADGTIARVAERTVPYSLDTVDSGEPVAAVLELNGGAAAAAGMAPGASRRQPFHFTLSPGAMPAAAAAPPFNSSTAATGSPESTVSSE